MNPDIKIEWLRRLRSSDYTQGQFKMRCADTHCCIGVLAEIIVEQGWADWTRIHPTLGDELLIKPEFTLPEEEWLPTRLKLVGPLLKLVGLGYADQDYLAKMNDEGESFLSIADTIESQVR